MRKQMNEVKYEYTSSECELSILRMNNLVDMFSLEIYEHCHTKYLLIHY